MRWSAVKHEFLTEELRYVELHNFKAIFGMRADLWNQNLKVWLSG
jgi:hypothetical protein